MNKIVENRVEFILSPMNFSTSLQSMFSSIIGQKDLGDLYDDLFSFGIIINVNVLKLITLLRSLYKILSSQEADELLYLLIAVLNSFFENGFHSEIGLE